jgi:hypothetical protein
MLPEKALITWAKKEMYCIAYTKTFQAHLNLLS